MFVYVMQTIIVNLFVLFVFLFNIKIPVLVILVTEKKRRNSKFLSACGFEKNNVDGFIGTHIWHIHTAYVQMGSKRKPKANSVMGSSLPSVSPHQEERGQQA